MRLLHRSILLSSLALLPPGAATAAEVTILSGPEDPLIHGVRGNDSSYRCSLSADGQQVAFESFAHQLVPGDRALNWAWGLATALALVALALAAALTSTVIAYEAIHFREARRRIRHGQDSM